MNHPVNQMTSHSMHQHKGRDQLTSFCTPAKQKRSQQLWQKAITAANAELQAIKDGDPSAVVICPTEVIEHIESEQRTETKIPPPLSKKTVGLMTVALVPVMIRYIWAYRKVARCTY
ncbi:MAG: hypothetical protein AAF485_09245 [Chloroflexota bacterium]